MKGDAVMASHNIIEDPFRLDIVDGPSKFDIMISLFDSNRRHRRTVPFSLRSLRLKLDVAITSVQQEDDSGESWNIEGWVTDGLTANVKGYYNSRRREGNFRFTARFAGAEEKLLANLLDLHGCS